MVVALPKHEISGSMTELDEMIETMMYRGENKIRSENKQKYTVYICNICGKEENRSHLKKSH